MYFLQKLNLQGLGRDPFANYTNVAEESITQCEVFGIDEAEAIDVVVACPVAQGVHDESPHRGMPTVQHPLGPVNKW